MIEKSSMAIENPIRDNRKLQWETSYQNCDNFLFYPSEEVIRFFAKYVRKRIGIHEFQNKFPRTHPKVLDLGCGIGRHVIYALKLKLDAYGIDLSDYAIQKAVELSKWEGIQDTKDKFVQGDVTKLPWNNDFFDIIVSHGVLDSMPYNMAKKTAVETARVLNNGGLFYCDLISGNDSEHDEDYAGEEVVETPHERNTVQSYFNFFKIKDLFEKLFEIRECILVHRKDALTGKIMARYHLVLQKLLKQTL